MHTHNYQIYLELSLFMAIQWMKMTITYSGKLRKVEYQMFMWIFMEMKTHLPIAEPKRMPELTLIFKV